LKEFRKTALTPDVIARLYAVSQPDDIDVNEIIVRPTTSAFSLATTIHNLVLRYQNRLALLNGICVMTLIHCHSALAFSNNFARKAISKKS